MLLKRLVNGIDRSSQGGGAVAAYRTGPKDARVELVGFPALGIPYVRNGWQRMLQGTLALAALTFFGPPSRNTLMIRAGFFHSKT